MDTKGKYEILRKLLKHSLRGFDQSNNAQKKREAAKKYRDEFIRLAFLRKPHLRDIEKELLGLVPKGCDICPGKIKPVLRICATKRDFDIFDYFSLWSSFPTRDRPGRRFKFLIFDEGQKSEALMGLGCIGSCVTQLKARDEWIGWTKTGFKDIRASKFAYIMDLTTCVGIPPYSFLTSGKLLCHIVLSNEFRALYSERYRNQRTRKLGRIVTDIALIVTCGAYSSNTPQYKGISLDGVNRFKFIGYTRGYSTFHIPQSVYNILIDELDKPELKFARYGERGSSGKIHVLRQVARILDIEEEQLVFSGHRRSVFVAPLARNCREFLQGKASAPDYYEATFDDVTGVWKRKWLCRRWKSAPVREQVKAFSPEEISLAPKSKTRKKTRIQV